MGPALDIEQHPIAMDMTTSAGFACALLEACKLKAGGLAVVAICCRSYSIMSPARI